MAIQYHSFANDPFGIQYSDDRYEYYDSVARPQAQVGGLLQKLGNSGDLVEIYRGFVEERLAIAPAVEILTTGDVAGTEWTIRGLVRALEPIQNGSSIRVAIIEDGLLHQAEVYDQVCRLGLDDIPLTALAPGDVQPFTLTFDLPGPVVPEMAQAIVWVQDDATTEVLNSKAVSQVSLAMSSTTPQVQRGDDVRLEFDVANISGQTQAVEIWVDGFMPNGAPAPGNPLIGPQAVVLPAGYGIEGYRVDLRVPPVAPFGTYELVASVGPAVDEVWEESRVEISVQP